METEFKVESVNVSPKKGVAKQAVPEGVARENYGIEGDAHAGAGHRQISLCSARRVNSPPSCSDSSLSGGFAENVTLRDFDLSGAAVFDRIVIGDVELEITEIGRQCHDRGARDCSLVQEGVFARVVRSGVIRPGTTGRLIAKPFLVHVVTLSDRASQGIYEDRSGPRIETLLRDFFQGRREHLEVARKLIADEPRLLEQALQQASAAEAVLVITTGSTGVGLRDIAPEVTSQFCTRLIPGIMEHCRTTFGAKKPSALLSRGVAGTRGQMIVINLPGSVRAVEEYCGVFFPLLDHIRFMMHGVDLH